ncbi:hypothetical protein [Metabacillus bambusae]|uniref:Uncharacterized protein n=1 Tax=Metabacillus bambusae TaxID=2795218 RepID=A0ABS3N5A6_9BACI|nr:hypothetical protein [Metabacillus bambusae]MBO1513234.1 hypothetical protein [Metabacillus bambusae]
MDARIEGVKKSLDFLVNLKGGSPELEKIFRIDRSIYIKDVSTLFQIINELQEEIERMKTPPIWTTDDSI